MSTNYALSIVAPCYNEAEGLAAFVLRMTVAAKAAVGDDFELILVDDGSRDQTWAAISALALDHKGLVGVRLSRNHGHQLAVTAGLSLVRGETVLVIDADLQDPPELLSDMLARLEEGYDVVFGRRRRRAGESAFKRTTASVFYRLLSALSENEIPVDTGDFRLMRRHIVERLNAMPERDRFIRGMVAWLGGRQTELLYDRDARHTGVTHYTLRRMTRLAVDGMIGFSTAPLRLAMLMALVGILAGIGLLAYVVAGLITRSTVPGWASLALIVVFFSTAQLICLSIFGEYLGRTYMQVKGRPLYMIDEIACVAPSKDENT